MRFSVAVTFLAALAEVAFGQNSCGATAASCPTVRGNAASRSSCSSYFTRNSIQTSTCYTSTVITTKYNFTKTSMVTVVSTARVTATSTRVISSFVDPSTTTYRPTTTTATATAYSTATSISTVRTTVTSFSTSTVRSTSISTIIGFPPSSSTGSNPSTLVRLRKRQTVSVPAPCSCFLFTSTVRTRGANEFPSGTTTITRSTTVVTTSSLVVTATTTLSIRGGIVTATSWVTSTVTVTQTLPTTVVSQTVITITQPATTVITSVVVEYTYVPPSIPDTSCPNNSGLEVGLYQNPYRIILTQVTPGYPTFDPTYFKTRQPYATIRTANIGLVRQGDGVEYDGYHPYGMTATATTYPDGLTGVAYALNHRGYFYAPKSATYIFQISQPDDVVLAWFGQKAYNAWTRQNANIIVTSEASGNVNTFQLTLSAGSYTPIRIMLGSGVGPGLFILNISDSLGNKYASTGTSSQYLVAFACDRPQDAPPFNPFGSETTQPTGPPDTSCNNAGMEVAIYPDPFKNPSGQPGYPDFSPEAFKETILPTGIKVVNSLGITWANDGVNQEGRFPYGFNPPQNPLEYTLNWRGYIYIPKSAKYTFKLAICDNWGGIWTGSKARAGWKRSNVDAESIWGQALSSPSQYELDIAGGTYLPLRVMLGNWAGAGSMDISIFDEDGNFLVRTSTASPYLVRFSCDGSAYPYDDPFGEEP